MLKPDYEGNEYEVWVIKPVRVGTLIRHGEKDLQVEGSSHRFRNIESAIEYLDPKLFAELGLRVPKDDVTRVSGYDLAKHADWQAFCEARELNERSFLSSPDKVYDLTAEEITEVGYKKNREMPPPPSKAPQSLRRLKQ